MYKFKDFVSLLLEANVYKHTEMSYKFNEEGKKKFPELSDISLSFSASKDFDDNSPIYSISNSKVKKITKEEALDLLKSSEKNVLYKSDGSDGTYFVMQGNVNLVVQITEKTSTDIKEGLVIYFYLLDINEKPNSNNILSIIEELKGISTSSVNNKTANDIKDWLENFKISKKNMELLTDFWSCADLIKSKIGPGFLVTRTGIFDKIRDIASKITNFPPDKWCPGDVYVINENFLQDIEKHLNGIDINAPDAIGQLNLIFNEEFNFNDTGMEAKIPHLGKCIAVSLKQEEARGGKAKEFLKSLTNEQTEYNLTKEEIDLFKTNKIDEIFKNIEEIRERIEKISQKAPVTIELIQERGYNNRSSSILKYAALKLAYFLIKDPNSLDENILKATGFGLSLSGVNPTFFKVIGSTTGTAKLEKFNSGETITLLYDGLKSKNSKIIIRDLNSNNSISFEFLIRKGEENKMIVLEARTNGNTQATLEIKRILDVK